MRLLLLLLLLLVVVVVATAVPSRVLRAEDEWYVEPKAHPIFRYGAATGSGVPEVEGSTTTDRKELNSKLMRSTLSPEEEAEALGRRVPVWYRPDLPFVNNSAVAIHIPPEAPPEARPEATTEALESRQFVSTVNLIRGTSTSTTPKTPTRWWDSRPAAPGGFNSPEGFNSDETATTTRTTTTSTTSQTPTQWWDSQPVVKPSLSPEDFYDYPLDEIDPPMERPNFQMDVAQGHLFRNPSAPLPDDINVVVVNVWNYIDGQLQLAGRQTIPSQSLAGIQFNGGLPATLTTPTPSRLYGGVGNPSLSGIVQTQPEKEVDPAVAAYDDPHIPSRGYAPLPATPGAPNGYGGIQPISGHRSSLMTSSMQRPVAPSSGGGPHFVQDSHPLDLFLPDFILDGLSQAGYPHTSATKQLEAGRLVPVAPGRPATDAARPVKASAAGGGAGIQFVQPKIESRSGEFASGEFYIPEELTVYFFCLPRFGGFTGFAGFAGRANQECSIRSGGSTTTDLFPPEGVLRHRYITDAELIINLNRLYLID